MKKNPKIELSEKIESLSKSYESLQACRQGIGELEAQHSALTAQRKEILDGYEFSAGEGAGGVVSGDALAATSERLGNVNGRLEVVSATLAAQRERLQGMERDFRAANVKVRFFMGSLLTGLRKHLERCLIANIRAVVVDFVREQCGANWEKGEGDICEGGAEPKHYWENGVRDLMRHAITEAGLRKSDMVLYGLRGDVDGIGEGAFYSAQVLEAARRVVEYLGSEAGADSLRFMDEGMPEDESWKPVVTPVAVAA